MGVMSSESELVLEAGVAGAGAARAGGDGEPSLQGCGAGVFPSAPAGSPKGSWCPRRTGCPRPLSVAFQGAAAPGMPVNEKALNPFPALAPELLVRFLQLLGEL